MTETIEKPKKWVLWNSDSLSNCDIAKYYLDWLRNECDETDRAYYEKHFPTSGIIYPDALYENIECSNNFDGDCFILEMSGIDKTIIVAHGSLGTWRGDRKGAAVYRVNNLAEAIKKYMASYRNYSDISFEFYIEDGKLMCRAPHHDGTDLLNFVYLPSNTKIEDDMDSKEVISKVQKVGKQLGSIISKRFGHEN